MTSVLSRVPRPASERGRDALGAAALALVLLALTVVGDGPDADAWADAATAVAACAALTFRRSAPVTVLLAAGVAFAAGVLLTGDVGPTFVPFMLALYTAVSRQESIAVALAIGALATVGVAGVLSVGEARTATDSLVVSGEIWVVLVTAFGVAMNLYRASVAKERERAAQAEAARDALARTRVAEERLRIARELHDAVGHHVAVMNVQAGVAEALLATDPSRAAEALGRVQNAGARVVEELPVMLRVLRQDEDDAHPTAGLAALDGLIAEAQDAGLRVAITRHGVPAEVPAATDHAAYRIVQEALSNARRYGDGAASVAVEADDAVLRIEVRNVVGAAQGAQGSGFGLVGMNERAVATGGSVRATQAGEEFVVVAALPLRREGVS